MVRFKVHHLITIQAERDEIFIKTIKNKDK